MDDCWHAPTRDPSTGAPLADPAKFPNGIKHLADSVHALGLKLGIYSDAGAMTCGRRYGSLGYEEIDAKTYASWDIDYLSQYDNCYNQGESGTPQISFNRYNTMSKALNATGRPILYSMCNWGDDGPWNWASTIANSWRISGDIIDQFAGYDDRCPCEDALDCKLPGYHCSAATIIDYAAPLGQKAYVGGWNDLDMLEVGNGGMTYDEYVAHFSMWALLKSPLILGHDLGAMTNETYSIITNSAIIGINQDRYHTPAIRRWRRALAGQEATYSKAAGTPSIQLWSGPVSDGSTVVAILNTGEEGQKVDLLMKDVFKDKRTAQLGRYRAYDLWQKVPLSQSRAGATGEGAHFTPKQQQLQRYMSKGYREELDGEPMVWGKDVGLYETMLPNVRVKAHSVRVFQLYSEPGAPKTGSNVKTNIGTHCDEL
ncbi:alpha-galactosidase [Clavulina sp. PMI_390]|nr:alpha-galactosidase [Clavulina sp. PMI_390]